MLRYVPAAELERIRALDADPYERAAAFADACRLNALYMIGAPARATRARPSAAWTSSPGSTSRCSGDGSTGTSPRRATTRPACTRC